MLGNGPSSRYARYFDIDWDPPPPSSPTLFLMPVLGDHYGRVLEAGELVIERHAGSLSVRYYDHEAPLSPRTLDEVLNRAAARAGSAELEELAAAYGQLPPSILTDAADIEARHWGKEELRARLGELTTANPAVAAAIDAEIEAVNHDPDALDGLLAAELPPGLLGHRERRALLPAVLQHRDARGTAGGRRSRVRRHPPPHPRPGLRRDCKQAEGGPRGRARRPRIGGATYGDRRRPVCLRRADKDKTSSPPRL